MGIQLDTERLTLRQLEERDWPFFLALQTDPAVMQYVSDPRPDTEIRARFDARLPAWTAHSSHWLCLMVQCRNTGTPLGVSGFLPGSATPAQAEAGYLFAPVHQGRGYATESLRAIVDLARALDFCTMTAVVSSGNLASQRVLERVGFTLVDTIPDAIVLAGTWHDDLHFRLALQQQPASNTPY